MEGDQRVINAKQGPAEGADWLDGHCWGCGSREALHTEGGVVICSPCSSDLFAPSDGTDAVDVSRRAYWESHALDRCWRCMSRVVDPADDLGLCASCRQLLAEAS